METVDELSDSQYDKPSVSATQSVTAHPRVETSGKGKSVGYALSEEVRYWFPIRATLAHGALEARSGERKHHLGGGLYGRLYRISQLLLVEPSQHVLDLVALREIMAHTEAQAREVAISYPLDDVVQTIVRAAAAFPTHPELSGRQVDVVADDQNVVFLHLLVLHPVFHGLAAQVHIGGGHHQDERASLVFPLRYVGVAVGAKRDRQFLG